MTASSEPPEEPAGVDRPLTLMTLRVYRVSPGGGDPLELGRTRITADKACLPIDSMQYPPCRCPQHRAATEAAERRR